MAEACTNAIKHAYPNQAVGVIDVLVDVDATWLRVVVRDDGVGIHPPVASPGLGMGVRIIKALTAKYTIDQCEPGTRTAMTFAREPRPPTPRST